MSDNFSAILQGGKSLLGTGVQTRFATETDSLTQIVNPNLVITLRKIPHINPVRHAAVENYRIEVMWDGFRLVHYCDASITCCHRRA